MGTIGKCTKDTCDVSLSVYGYLPGLGENIFFATIFGVMMIAHTFLGIRYRQWTFMGAMILGNLCESVGSGTRLILHNDPFSSEGLKIQLVLLTIAPAFLAACIYFCLKYLVEAYSRSLSRIPPAWYTYIFISCDVLSLVLQGIGGGIAAGAEDGDKAAFDTGNNVMMAGLGFQVFTLLVFGILALEYAWRVVRDIRTNNGASLDERTVVLRSSRHFKGFLIALAVAYLAIQARCIYRLIEMAGGWGNELMQNEDLFTVLDAAMCAIAVIVFIPFHPGMIIAKLRAATTDVESKAGALEKASSTDLPANYH